MIDWGLAERVASFVAGAGGGGASGATAGAGAIDAARLEQIGSHSAERVVAYSELAPLSPLPAPEQVDRREWIAANLASMRPLLEPLVGGATEGLGPLAPAVRAATETLLAAQVGVMTGYMAQRVMGQYDTSLLDPHAPARLLFVAPNLGRAARELEADPDELLAWVGFHEVTHAVQFASVPWLREHMAALVRELLESVTVNVDPTRLLRLPSGSDLRALVAALREGDLISFVAGPARRALIDRLQATMAMIEGHAEHVMDGAGADVLPSLARLRDALDRRRRERPPLLRVLERLLGLEMKMRQYELGRSFCDAVVAEAGVVGLNRAWESPELLPTLPELERPRLWLERSRAA